MGREEDLRDRLDEDPEAAKAVGAQGIPIIPHAVWSGNLQLAKLVQDRGATSGANLSLHNAIVKSQPEIVLWLLQNVNPDPHAKNYQGKTSIAVPEERKNERIMQLLKTMELQSEVGPARYVLNPRYSSQRSLTFCESYR